MTETTMNGLHLYYGFLSGYENISRHREHINRINVFPVPDGDTGNNMIKTIKSIVSGMNSHRSAGKTMETIADLSLEGARGNSGIILSQYLNGLARKLRSKKHLTVPEFAQAAQEAVQDAYGAMESPKEGTILTVMKEWADALCRESLHKMPIGDLFTRAFEAAKAALHRTTEQLQVLKENHVVDAGAWGFVSFLEGIEKMKLAGFIPKRFRKETVEVQEISEAEHNHRFDGPLPFRYCTEALVENCKTPGAKIRKKLRDLGDSLIVSEGLSKTRVHIHTNHPDQMVQILRKSGTVSRQKVDDMFRQKQLVNEEHPRVGILTDSIADIPREILDQYKIHVISLKILWDEEEYLDRLTLSPEDFYRQQAYRESFPSSSIPERSRAESVYQFLMEHYDSLVVLPVGKELSGTWRQLSLAAESWNKEKTRIHVLDTCLNSAAQGLIAVEAARMAGEGKEAREIVEAMEALKKRSRIYVSLNTFKFMVKGGRVSPMVGAAAKLLHLKPIVSLDEKGKGKAFDKAFSRKGLEKKITNLLSKTLQERGIERYCIVHAAAPEEAQRFAELVEKVTGTPPDYVTSISPVVGMHSGKGAVAIGLIESK